MKSIYGKRKNYRMPSYLATPEENAAYKYCVKNNIRISPKGIQNDPDHWYIDISCLLYTSPSPRDYPGSRMPSSA